MAHRALQVQVQLNVQAITCPGVYLCTSGKICLQLYMLGSCVQTECAEPAFPIICRERYIFYKTFHSPRCLFDLQKILNDEYLYIELIQWKNCEVGNVLATFQATLTDFLYPITYQGDKAGVNIDLLMERAPNFPGIIAPKIEINTKTIIEDTIYDGTKCELVLNSKVVASGKTKRVYPKRQKKVCHSNNYHWSRRCFANVKELKKPPFTYRKADDNLIGRKPQGLGPEVICECHCKRLKLRKTEMKPPRTTALNNTRSHVHKVQKSFDNCEFQHTNVTELDDETCLLCSKYKYYFPQSNYQSHKESGNLTEALQEKYNRFQDIRSCLCEKLKTISDTNAVRCTCDIKNHENIQCSKRESDLHGEYSRPNLTKKLCGSLSKLLYACEDCGSDGIDCITDALDPDKYNNHRYNM